MALQLDPDSGLPLDPATLQAIQEQNMMKNVAEAGGGAAFRLNNEAMQRSANTLFPNLAMRQSQQMSQAMQGLNLEQQPGEDQLSFNIRQLQAQRDEAAKIDPMAAAKMNIQLTKLGVMQTEQQRLKAQDQREQTTYEAEAGKRAYEKTIGGRSFVLMPDANTPLGWRALGSYDTTKPEESQALLDMLSKNKGAIPMGPDKAAQIFSSANTADMKIAGELARAASGANAPLPTEAVPGMAIRAVFDPQVQSRMNGNQKAQLQEAYDKAGVTGLELAGAKTEQKVLYAAAGAEGRRAGNIAILQQEIAGMGDAVTQSMQGLTRTDFTPLNAAIMGGKRSFSDPGESKYSVAIQSLVNTYARVIAGGTGQSTEGARAEAWAMLNKASSPAAIKAAIDFMRDKEMTVVGQASDSARELIARPENYKSLWAIQNKIQHGMPLPSNADLAVTHPSQDNPPPSAAAGPLSFKSEADIPANLPKGTKIIVNGVAGTWQ